MWSVELNLIHNAQCIMHNHERPQVNAPLLGNRRSLFVERAKRGKQWVGGGFYDMHNALKTTFLSVFF